MMPSKRKNGGDSQCSSPAKKRQHKIMSLDDKIIILDRLSMGSTASSIASDYGVNESTIRSIRKSEDKIRATVSASGAAPTNTNMKVSFVNRRNPLLEKMEKLLNVWIEDESQRNENLGTLEIRKKALDIYDSLKVHYGESSGSNGCQFQASKGWFDNFKKRFSLNNIKLSDAIPPENNGETKDYTVALAAHIKEKGYRPSQVFNADEMGLFWRKLPGKDFVSSPRPRAAIDRLTLLLCCNAAGDYKCKPMLVYHEENPRALKGKKKQHLPVFWRSNKKAWVTATLFEDWFENCFVHEVEKYLKGKNLPFKVLLLVDNVPAHPASLLENHPNVEVVFLPSNSSAMDNGILATFKCCYMRRIFTYILQTNEADPSLSARECCKKFNILNAIDIIKASWDEVKETTINACWKKLLLDGDTDDKGMPCMRLEVNRILELARNVEDFQNIVPDDVFELLESHTQELSNEEVVELCQPEENEAEEDEEQETPQLTLKALAELFKMVNQVNEKIIKMDPFMERSITVKRKIDAAMASYKEVYKDMKKKERQTPTKKLKEPSTSTSL